MAKKATAAAAAATRVCPVCNVAGPVRLAPGQACAACVAQGAWTQAGEGDRPLVIDQAAIAEAERRRAGEAAGEPLWRRALVWLPPALAFASAGLAAYFTIDLLSARPLESLDALLASLTSAIHRTTLAGLAALVIGIVTLVRLRKNRHFRKLPLVLGHALALVVAAAAVVIGSIHWIGTGSFGGQYTTMPKRDTIGMPSHVQRVLDATVVVLATGRDGDARELALGTGAVIAGDDKRAWIVTCSHVALPDASVGAWRDAREAPPVWAQLSDGRQGRATVRWVAPPPVDVVVLELPIDHPPAPVPIAGDTLAMQPDAPVMFVPNPYRNGWHVMRGAMLKRETHHTPAGTYDLLFTDLPVIPGDSGSGLYDEAGELVGINTWTRTGNGPAQGISLPSETMRGIVDKIRSGQLESKE